MVSVVLIVCVGAVSALYLEHALRSGLEAGIASQLEAQARVAGDLAQGNAALPELLGRITQHDHSRLTIIAPEGAVIADSAIPIAKLAALASHAQRPEVIAAQQGRVGVARRQSETIGDELLYVAIQGPEGRTIRAATRLSTVDGAVSKMRFMLLMAGALGLAVALFMSVLASKLVAHPLQALLETARGLAERHGRPLPVHVDELGGLANSLDHIGRDLQDVVGTLAAERDRIEAVLESMDEVVIALDAEGRVALVNRAGLDLLDLDATPVGRPLLEAVRAPVLHDALGPALEGDSGVEVEITLPGPEPRHLLARITPQKASPGAVIVMLDVTRLRRLETIRRDFVANVSHELRTPVSVIRANAETLIDGAIHDEVRGPIFLGALMRNAVRLSALISDLLDIARIESGKFPIQLEATAVANPAVDALEAIQPAAQKLNTQVSVALEEDLIALADAKALTQVLTNLLENAVKYIPAGGHVELVGHRQGQRVILDVCDDGPGIPLEHHGRIFERFYRVDAGRSKEMGGTGLGLSIVKHLVVAMGGRVSVHTNPPHGAMFRVDLAAYDVQTPAQIPAETVV